MVAVTSATKVGTPASEAFDDALQRHRLAGAGRARDQAVAVGALEVEHLRLATTACRADKNAVVRHQTKPLPNASRTGA